MTLHLRGTLVCVGPLAIGTGHPDVRSDQPVLADQRGLPVIPGSSLAGALRAAASRVHDAATVKSLMGPSTIGADDPAERSAVTVHDSLLDLPGIVPPRQLRQHVGIDRERLAAREAVKFDRETWPLGLRFHLALTLEGDGTEELLDPLLLALGELAGPLGGVGAGRCPVVVEDLTVHRAATTGDVLAAAERRWDHPEEPEPLGERIRGPIDLAALRGPHQDGVEGTTAAVELHLRLRTLSPLLVREPMSPFEQAEDNVPFSVRRVEGTAASARIVRRPAVPGDSLLGVIRQRAERALALAGLPGGDPFDDLRAEDRDLTHPVLRTFGLVGSAEDSASGAVRVEDAVLVDRAQDDSLWVEGGDRTAGEQPWAVMRPRVHIDRLTSAPLGSEKFDDTALADGRDLEVRITVAPTGRTFEDLDLALVAVGLRDVLAGATGVGGSVRSGYGTLGLVSATLVEHVRPSEGGPLRALPPVDLGNTVEEDGVEDDSAVRTGLAWGDAWSRRLDAAWHEAIGGAR
jgi:CRISPR/Cas system CSM-associated protein Csm3 (group 7 of RAMP superfamily)